MYRILIADDEGIMVEALRSMIAREYGDRCEIATAKTGREAIERSEVFHPDIVLMDIQMPGINGISAMTEIRKFNRTVLFYVISAYDKFDYAQDAIALGVIRYLTKPVSRSAVHELMEEAIRKVDEMRQQRSEQLRAQEKLETVIPIVENGLISHILLQSSWQETEYYRQLLEVTEEYGYVCVFQFAAREDSGEFTSPVGMGMAAQQFYPEFRAIVKSYLSCIIGSVMTDRIVAVVPCREAHLEYEERVKIIELLRSVVARLEERLKLRFRAGIGRLQKMENMYTSYLEAIGALQEGESHVVHAADVRSRGYYEGDYPADTEKELFACVTRGDLTQMTVVANRFFDWMMYRKEKNMDNIRLKILECVIWAERQAFASGAVNYDFDSRNSYLPEMMAFTEYEELRGWFLKKMEDTCRSIRDKRTDQSETAVSRARIYIEENYTRDISLDEVSREVNISPYYFSKLFKEEAGENFIVYLTRLRMEKARELLADRSLSMKEISARIGYADPNYFSRIFKKQTGMTPREYQETLQVTPPSPTGNR